MKQASLLLPFVLEGAAVIVPDSQWIFSLLIHSGHVRGTFAILKLAYLEIASSCFQKCWHLSILEHLKSAFASNKK